MELTVVLVSAFVVFRHEASPYGARNLEERNIYEAGDQSQGISGLVAIHQAKLSDPATASPESQGSLVESRGLVLLRLRSRSRWLQVSAKLQAFRDPRGLNTLIGPRIYKDSLPRHGLVGVGTWHCDIHTAQAFETGSVCTACLPFAAYCPPT